MKERPILFSAPMAQAINADRKTQTRRALKDQPKMVTEDRKMAIWDGSPASLQQQLERIGKGCPYGQPGDRLLVRETFFAYGRWETRFSAKKGRDEWHFIDMTEECGFSYLYAADNPDRTLAQGRGTLLPGWHRRPAIFMPRRAVRIFLKVVAVRVERLRDITQEDAREEGIIQQSTTGWFSVPGINGAGTTARAAYALLWISINGAESWDENPWVWVVEFKRIEPPKNED